MTPDEYDRWVKSLRPPPDPPTRETVWTLMRGTDRAELRLLRTRDREGCELALFINGEFLRSQFFHVTDEDARKGFAANERHALELQGWTDGTR